MGKTPRLLFSRGVEVNVKKIQFKINMGIYGTTDCQGYGRNGLVSHKGLGKKNGWQITHVASGQKVAHQAHETSNKKESLAQQERLHSLPIDWNLSQDELEPSFVSNMQAIIAALHGFEPQ